MSKLLEELRKRADRKTFNLEEFCFDKQLAFITDTAKFKTAVCSRRAGKTLACAADLFHTAIEYPDVNVLYITLSRTTAKRIVWKELLKLQEMYAPDATVDKTELVISLPNKSTIYVSGAKDESEIEKIRGMSLKKVYIDECQSFRPYIQNLVDDIIVPALYDYDGSLVLIGTPGPVATGYFYSACHSSSWSNHRWTILDNPWIKIKSKKEPAEILAAERARRGITEADPTYMRESLGIWTNDINSLVYQFDSIKNTYLKLPQGRMEYIFGIDLGFNDADAIAVLGYSYVDKRVYLIEEYVQDKNDITALVEAIVKLQKKYNPVRMVMDAGALGKKIQSEIVQRHKIPVEAADKNRKFEFIALLNDDMRTGKFQSFPNSKFEQDCSLVQWDRDRPEKPKVSDRYHTDIGDAVLYGWRECKHYLWEPTEKKPHRDSEEYMRALEDKEADELEKQLKRGPQEEISSQADIEAVFEDEWKV